MSAAVKSIEMANDSAGVIIERADLILRVFEKALDTDDIDNIDARAVAETVREQLRQAMGLLDECEIALRGLSDATPPSSSKRLRPPVANRRATSAQRKLPDA